MARVSPSPTPPPPVLDADACHVKPALNTVTNHPNSQRHIGPFVAAEDQNSDADRHKGEIPENVEEHHGLRIRPIALPLFQLLRCGFSDHHRRLSHHPPASSVAEEPRCLSEALAPSGSLNSVLSVDARGSRDAGRE